MIQIPERKSFARRRFAVMVGMATVATALALMWTLNSAVSHELPDDDSVHLVKAEQGPVVRTVSGFGKLLPRDNFIVKSQVEGRVREILKQPGEEVGPNEQLVVLENIHLARRLEAAEIEVMEARATLESTEARIELEMLRARTEHRLAESDAELSKRRLEMLKKLVERNSISEMDYLESEMETRRAELRASLSSDNLAVTDRAVEAELRADRLRVEIAAKSLQSAEADLALLRIPAERAGVLTTLHEELQVGAVVERGQTIGEIAIPGNLYAELFVTASDARMLNPSQQVEILVQDRTLRGRVQRVDPSVSNGQVRVTAFIDDQDLSDLRANVDVSARIQVAAADPNGTRLQRPTRLSANASTVDVFIEQDGYFELQTLPVGLVGDDHVRILSGVTPGQQVVISVPEKFMGRDRITLAGL